MEIWKRQQSVKKILTGFLCGWRNRAVYEESKKCAALVSADLSIFSVAQAQDVCHDRFEIYTGTRGRAETIWNDGYV